MILDLVVFTTILVVGILICIKLYDSEQMLNSYIDRMLNIENRFISATTSCWRHEVEKDALLEEINCLGIVDKFLLKIACTEIFIIRDYHKKIRFKGGS